MVFLVLDVSEVAHDLRHPITPDHARPHPVRPDWGRKERKDRTKNRTGAGPAEENMHAHHVRSEMSRGPKARTLSRGAGGRAFT